MTTFTRTWDAAYEAIPSDSHPAKEGAQRIRHDKIDTRERTEVDHSWAGDAHDGKHKKVTLVEQGSDPTLDANNGAVYTKDVSTITELFYKDSAGSVMQLTSGGAASVPRRSVVTVSGNTTLTFAAHQGRHIKCAAGTYTLTFDPAATLGNGFWCAVENFVGATVTIDAAGTEVFRFPHNSTTQNFVLDKASVLIVGDGSQLVVAWMQRPLLKTTVFTASSSYAVPLWVSKAKVTVVGGGGAGGGIAPNGTAAGGGGGAGGAAIKIVTLTPGGSETVTVGAGGTGTAGAGNAGGTSSFGAHSSATGGAGGVSAGGLAFARGATGGAGSSGDLNIKGGPGGVGCFDATNSASGPGGDSILGGGGASVTGDVAGNAGGLYGGGGSGASREASGSAAGGAGAAGVVIVEELE